jgi:hypothetical protein
MGCLENGGDGVEPLVVKGFGGGVDLGWLGLSQNMSGFDDEGRKSLEGWVALNTSLVHGGLAEEWKSGRVPSEGERFVACGSEIRKARDEEFQGLSDAAVVEAPGTPRSQVVNEGIVRVGD